MPAPAGRTALLDAALLLFAERGFDGSSTRAIAERAGVPQGLVRHHFGSKDALYREVVERGLGMLARDLAAAPQPISHEAIADAALPAAPLLSMLVHALLEPGARRDWLAAQLRPLLQRSGPALAAFLARPAPLGEQAALALAGALIGPLLIAPLLLSRAEPDSLPSSLLARLLRQSLGSLGAPGPAGPWAPLGVRATRRH